MPKYQEDLGLKPPYQGGALPLSYHSLRALYGIEIVGNQPVAVHYSEGVLARLIPSDSGNVPTTFWRKRGKSVKVCSGGVL